MLTLSCLALILAASAEFTLNADPFLPALILATSAAYTLTLSCQLAAECLLFWACLHADQVD
jgi:hypothetical protein